MFKFFKKHKKVALLGSLLTFSLTSTIVASVAWFIAEGRDTINNLGIDSGVQVNYFDETSGDGSSASNAFVISKPEHLFNLMELMKSDTAILNGENAFYKNSYYFQFGVETAKGRLFYDFSDEGVMIGNTPTSKTLNMKYYSDKMMLTPIGSPSHPFIGHIEGHNLTVDKVTINGTDCSDVGIFGYVASPATISNLYFDNLTIDVGVSNLTGQTPEGGSHNTSNYHENNATVGYIVGHIYDADAALTNVYVNNCSIVNQSAGNKAVSNNFGYIGKSDANVISGASSQTSSVLKASTLHNYLSNNHSNIQGYDFATSSSTNPTPNAQSVTRDAGYSGSGTVGSKITSSSGNYSFTNKTSLATAGYSSDKFELKDVRYEDGTEHLKISPSTEILSSAPEANSLSDGHYLYYDSSLETDNTKSNWRYLEVSTPQGVVTKVQLNCFYMTYDVNGTTYYATYNNGNLVGTNIAPASASADQRPNYYFCLRESVGSYGISNYSTENSADFHIYSPAADKYLNASTSGVSSNFTFTNNFSSSLEFKQEGNGNSIKVKDNQAYAFLTNGTSITLKRYVSTDGDMSTICFMGVENAIPQPSYESDYSLVTNVNQLQVDDIVTFVRNDGGTYRAISDQAKNNRLTSVVTVTGSGNSRTITASNAKTLASFALEDTENSGHPWAFKDTNTNQYLYSAGTKPTGSNYLKSQDTNNTKGYWSIALNSSNEATVESMNTSVPYLDFVSGSNNDGDYYIFRAFRSASSKPLIFKRSQNTEDPTLVYPSFQYEVSTTSSSQPDTQIYNLRYDDVGAQITSTDPLLNDNTAVFDLMNSRVTIKKSSGGHYQLVKNVSSLSSGDTIIIGNGTSSSVRFLSATQNSNNRGATDAVTVDSNGKVSSLPSNIEEITLGTWSSYWTFYANNSSTKGYLYAASSSSNYLRTQTQNNSNGDWTISITSEGIATITAQGSNTHNLLQYNSGSTIFSCYASTQASVAIYKFISDASNPETTFIGDQIGDGYNPDYIDVVGAFTSTSTAMEFSSSSGVSAPNMNSKFQAASVLTSSAVVFAEYSGSMDLGRIDIEYTQTTDNSLKVNKNGGTLKSIESDLSISNSGDETNHLNTLFITTTNIKFYAMCALDLNGNVVATFDGSGNITGSTDNAKYYVIDLRANGGSVSISRIEYLFTKLPGNNGNFGQVGYRSADYENTSWNSSTGVWTQTTPNHATNSTILNYYFDTPAGVYSYIEVKYEFTETKKIYRITAYCTQTSELYLFNYDPTEYDVYVNGMQVLAGSNNVTINATAYDFETGWAV
jgi:hypothetical protein